MNIRDILSIALAAAIAAVATACGDGKRGDADKQVKYEIMKLHYQSKTHHLYIPASLHGVNEVEVYPQVEGIIREVNFTDGTKVTAGQTLFVIDQTEHKLNIQNAEADLAAARAQMETTKLKYESDKRLAEKKIISDYVLSTSKNAYHAAQAAVQQSQARLAIARTNLGYCTVKSPISGMIKENGFKVGALANQTDLLCTVSDNSKIQAWFSYTEQQLLEVMAGKKLPPLKLQLRNGSTYRYEGIVTEIGGIVDRSTGTVICKATFPNPEDELRSGLSATLIFPTLLDSVFIVPQTAAVHLQNQLMFYRVTPEGTAEGILCDAILSNNGKLYYILNGLKEGDELIVSGARKLSNGVKIR